MSTIRCHAGSGCGEAKERGAFGHLCDACWKETIAAMRARGYFKRFVVGVDEDRTVETTSSTQV